MGEASEPPARWRVLGTEYLFRRPWLTLRRDRLRAPTGAVIEEYYVWEYPPWVNVVAVTADDRLVLVRQYRHGLGDTHYELPAGVMDPSDSDPLAAARRELLEETGYGGGTWSPLLTSSANPATHNNLTHSFLAIGVAPVADATPEATEDLEVSLVSRAEARALATGGGMVQSLHLAALLTYLFVRAEAGAWAGPADM
jgi:8-oxo-dGTP pyrophosphatase MutT (NUDIX family)